MAYKVSKNSIGKNTVLNPFFNCRKIGYKKYYTFIKKRNEDFSSIPWITQTHKKTIQPYILSFLTLHNIVKKFIRGGPGSGQCFFHPLRP